MSVTSFFREFQEKMKVFAQFHSSTDHEQFFENLQSKSVCMFRKKISCIMLIMYLL